MRVVPRYKGLTQSLPRRLRWTRTRVPTRRRIPKLYRPEGHVAERPSARVSLLHLLATAVVVLVCWAAGSVFAAIYAGRIYPHVTIDGVPVGGMTRAEALAALQYSETARLNSPIYITAGDKNWQVTPAQFGAHYDVTTAVDRALALAHGGPPIIGGWTELQTIWQGANVPLNGTHNSSGVARFLAHIAPQIYVAPRSAEIGIKNGDVTLLRRPVAGQQLDAPRAVTALGAAVNTRAATAVTLPLQPVESALGLAQADDALSRARALLSAPIRFEWTSDSPQYWLLTRAGLLRLLTFSSYCGQGSCHFNLGINQNKLAQAFNRGGVDRRVDQPPTRASYLLYVAGNPRLSSVRVVQDFPGRAIDIAATATKVLQLATAPPDSRAIILPTRNLQPDFTASDALALNFNLDVGYSATHFSGLDWGRLNNLNVAANVISSTVVAAGKTFDLAKVAGPFIGGKYGYIAGQDIVGPRDITGANSGVGLLASGVLAAAYDAGLKIVQRNHYPYANAYMMPGLDAVVTYGQKKKKKRSPDLIFRNTTDHPILVMTSNDGAGGVGVYIFNSAGYAPAHQRGAYTSATSAPQITLHPDGSVDATIARSVTVNGHTTQDHLSSHYAPIDP